MANINVLPKEIAELIAAGEVVERPASVIKELVENSIDAGATVVAVEIERGGITYMRVTDNGSGIKKDQVKTAFLRHATSKIQTADDLDAILSLGFRGEALASISAVAKVELLTKTREEDFGIGYVIEGSEEVSFEEVGCPEGTTIIIRDLFYNVPARMKFLKKDVSEANTVSAVLERLALSHPEVSFKLIRDGKITLSTSGDGKLKSAIYSVLGRDFSSSLIEVSYDEGSLKAEGFVCMPSRCRPNRNGQFFFLNGRYIKSGTMAAALDQAYKNSAMVGKFPAAVLNLTVPAGGVDVNVHPTKTEVRFSDERSIFELVYRATKQAITLGDRRPELKVDAKKALNPFLQTNEYSQLKVEKSLSHTAAEKKAEGTPKEEVKPKIFTAGFEAVTTENEGFESSEIPFLKEKKSEESLIENIPIYTVTGKENKTVTPGFLDIAVEEEPAPDKSVNLKTENSPQPQKTAEKSVQDDKTDIDADLIGYIGEAFATYILVSVEDTIYFIDKHAAHERINFEKLKMGLEINCQTVIPISVSLVREEYNALIGAEETLKNLGFIIEDFGENTVVVRGVPSILSGADINLLITEIAGNLLEKGTAESDKIDDILHSIACKSAIKAGNITSKEEQLSLAKRVLTSKKLMYCPHGRPIAFSLKKSQIEKQFGRLG